MTGATRVRLRGHGWAALLLVAAAASCTSQPTILPSRDFDRPTDMTFVCLGAFDPAAVAADGGAPDDGGATEAGAAGAGTGQLVVSGRPMRDCHPRGTSTDPKPDPPASVSARTFAFLPQSSSGQLAVVDADDWSLVDLDPANAGFNQAPLGVLPTQITASEDGCRLATANHGSCDLSLVDPAALMAPTLAAQYPNVMAPTGNAVTTTVQPKTAAGELLRAFPGEVAFIPHPTDDPMLCSAAWSWRALVTFPSCDLVALVDVPSGVIVDGAYVRRKSNDGGKTTFVEVVPLQPGEAPVCAAPDCRDVDGGAGGVAPDAAVSDATASDAQADGDAGADGGAPEAGAPATVVPIPPLRPGPIAIVPETGRAYVGLANGDVVVALDATKEHLSGWMTIPLAEGAMGTTRLRLSIDPYADKTAGAPVPGRFVGTTDDTGARPYVQDRQYLYAIARDGSVRVVQVAFPTMERECETNVDPQQPLPAGTTLHDACIPVNPQLRRPTQLGPGIRPPSPPIDVAVADVRPNPPDQSEGTVGGAHAWILTASGNVYLANINPVQREVFSVEPTGEVKLCVTPSPDQCRTEPEPAPNTLRDRNFLSYSLSLDPSTGPARLDAPPTETTTGPRIESVFTRGTADNATALTSLYQETAVFFPDPTGVTSQTWTVTWEGALMPTPRLSGQVTMSPAPALYDPGNDFCRLGVQKGDLVTLTGCSDDTQCGINQACRQGNEGTLGAGGLPISGLCLPKEAMPETCDVLLSTVRRYEVDTARPGLLTLLPHKDELVRPTALAPCQDDTAAPPAGDGGVADGGSDATTDGGGSEAGADGGPAGPSDCVDPLDPTTSAFTCVDHRCLQRCTEANTQSGCRSGRLCVPFDDGLFCADGPKLEGNTALFQECVGQLVGYQVSVGGGFLVVGSATGIRRTEIAVQDPASPGQAICAPDPNRGRFTVMRIPMSAPRCKNENLDPATAMVDPAVLDSRCNPDTADRCAFTPQQLDEIAKQTADLQASGVEKNELLAQAQARRNVATDIANRLVDIAKGTVPDPDPCLFVGGPNETDTGSPPHVHALFRNDEIQFMMTNLDRAPTGIFQTRFDVHGGFRPAFVTLPSTVEVTMPARIFLSPIDAMQTDTAAPEVPYLFVVDQRRLGRTTGGGPTRGQLLRIHPLGFAVPIPKGNQPWYEDFTNSGNKFPIQ